MEKLEYCLIELHDKDKKAYVHEPDGKTTYISYPDVSDNKYQKVLVHVLCFMGKMRWEVVETMQHGEQILMKWALVEKRESE